MVQTTALILFSQMVFDILLPHQTTKMFDLKSKKNKKTQTNKILKIMKKVAAILVVVIALVGLSSYNSKEVKKEKGGEDDTLIASVLTNTKGTPIMGTTKSTGSDRPN